MAKKPTYYPRGVEFVISQVFFFTSAKGCFSIPLSVEAWEKERKAGTGTRTREGKLCEDDAPAAPKKTINHKLPITQSRKYTIVQRQTCYLLPNPLEEVEEAAVAPPSASAPGWDPECLQRNLTSTCAL